MRLFRNPGLRALLSSGSGSPMRTALQLGLLALLSLVAISCREEEEPRPSVLLVYIDTLRADHLASYGYPRETSPFFDRLAREGVRFTRAYAPSPWTYPSSASLMTGLYPATHGAIRPGKVRKRFKDMAPIKLAPEFTTMAEVLEGAGIRTALFAANAYLGFGVQQGFGTYEFTSAKAAEQSDYVIRWLQGLGADERFMLVAHYIDVHAPNAPPLNDVSEFYEGEGELNEAEARYYGRMQKQFGDGAPEALPGFEIFRRNRLALYDASIRHVDREVERIWDTLAELGRSEDTLVILTADHGEAFWEHAALEKAREEYPRDRHGMGHGHSFFEELVRIPLILRHPSFHGGDTIPVKVSLVDLRPTVLDFMGVDDPSPVEGHSLLPWMRGVPAPKRPLLFDAVAYGRNKSAILYGGRKLVVSEGAPPLLFNLREDPGESRDLAAEDSATLERLRVELAERLERSRELGERIRRGAALETGELSAEQRESLKALGYLEED
ncbi:MAG: sulfatase [Deltaproteobacteria bacterium]|nr:sulfatase [Deltaproteobacteria bacterium]MBW2418800.1 sulfatase [Deltaproteobacteria bacterium]